LRWRSIFSEQASYQECLSELKGKLADEPSPDLTFAFFSEAYSAYYREFSEQLQSLLGQGTLVGCSASGLCGEKRETEFKAGATLLCGWAPGVSVTPFHLRELPDLDSPPSAWRDLVAPDIEEVKGIVLLGDPFSLEAEALLSGLDFAYPGAPKVGGLASGCQRPGEAALFCGGRLRRRGCVGVALGGEIEVSTSVAQGCEPVGEQMVITECRGNVILELDNKPATLVLTETVRALSKDHKRAARRTVFVGLGAGQPTLKYEPGDFLVRQVLGLDPRIGCIAVAARLRKGQTVQFHLRDAQTSKKDLETVLGRVLNADQAEGALLFSCLGRGHSLYGEVGHDTRVFHEVVGDVPLSGFFCNGEIGPVGGESALHGFTSSFALFR
jgi:small ligand-binding sensory domain FIST